MSVVAISSFVSLLFVALISKFSVASEDLNFHGAVFTVKSKLSWKERTLSVLKAIDSHRHLQPLATGIDIPIGGNGHPDSVGLYYTKIGIGTPSKEYNVQVDTGRDIMWINCIENYEGHNKVGRELYDPNASFTGKLVTCDEKICKDINGGIIVNGCKANASCHYNMSYANQSSSMGFLVNDVVKYDSVSFDFENTPENRSVTFGYIYIAISNNL